MNIAYCKIELFVPSSQSLKDKRRVVSALLNRLKHKYNISVAEIEHLEQWQRSTIGFAMVSSDKHYLTQQTSRIIDYLTVGGHWDFELITVDNGIIGGV